MAELTLPLKQGARQAWASLRHGWRELRQRAGGALTRFRHTGESANDLGARWGLVAADLRVEPERVVVRMEVPGMSREDLQIDIDGNRLCVSGEKRLEETRGDGDYRLVQCAYGRFQRELVLPHAVDAQRTQASYHNGVLHIDMPRTDQHRGRRIPVHAAP